MVTPSSLSPLGGASSPPLVDRGLRRGLGRETELREPVLHVEVEPAKCHLKSRTLASPPRA